MSYFIMILLISVLVILHELGHLLVARACGVKVERFGLGLPLGPTLWKKNVAGIELCIHPLPFGGYVAFPDDSPDSPVPEDSIQRFENQPLLNRAAIAVAGITVNAIVAYLLMAFIILVWGAEWTPVQVLGNRVDSQPVALSTITRERPTVATAYWQGQALSPNQAPASLLVRLAPYVLGEPSATLTLATPGTTPNQVEALTLQPGPSAQAGLKAGDTIVALDDEPVTGYFGQSFDWVKQHFAQASGRSVDVAVLRGNQRRTVKVTPNAQGQVGIFLNPWAPTEIVRIVNPFEALAHSVGFMHYIVVKNFEGLGQLVTGQVDRSMVDGPIGIVAKGGQVIEQHGIQKGLLLTAIISMILAVMNLLPIPPLDGSHLIFLAIEAIKGSPVNKAAQERVIQIGFFGLMALMIFIVFNDVAKVFTGGLGL